jgi:hypothetical protein
LDVGPLAGSTIPSPTGTVSVLNDWPVQWDQRTALPERADGAGVEGTRISMLAAPAQPEPDDLRQASRQAPAAGGQLGEAAADPEPLTGPRLPGLAEQVTAGSTSPFDAALSLQRWFTDEGGFTYSTQVEGGSDEAALEEFLDERVGYCEQFAATMALMARSVGIPARVMVGFTQGRRDGDAWVVRGTDAHAWPELWMGAAGWVRFEPTPGAPTTAAPAYTRADSAPLGTEQPIDEASPSTGPTQGPAPLPLDEAVSEPAAGTGSGRAPLAAALGALALLALLAPAMVRALRRRRRLRAGDAESAYREVVASLVDLGLGREAATPRLTLAQVAARAAHGAAEGAPADGPGPGGDAGLADLLGAVDAVERIREAVESQRYGAGAGSAPAAGTGSGPGAVAVAARTTRDGLSEDVRAVRRALASDVGVARRVTALLWPRSLLRQGRRAERAGP